MRRRTTLSINEARRVALSAQGFSAQGFTTQGTSTPQGTGTQSSPSTRDTIGTRQLRRQIARLGILQLDSVNVFERSHYLPLFSRLGAYDRATLDALLRHDRAARTLGPYTEYLAHEAAVMPVEDWPLWEWRRQRQRAKYAAQLEGHESIVAAVSRDLAAGPRTVADIDHEANVTKGGGWWNHNDVQQVMTLLFHFGDIVTVNRRRFVRSYALTETALPTELQTPEPRADAMRELVRRASKHFGVGTVDDFADYYRLPVADAQLAVRDLVDDGTLLPVDVENWQRPAFLRNDQAVPRSVDAATILSPFDPVVWHRPRALRLFDFHYRISIYTPKEQRVHGYYVLPVLVGDRLVGRIDLKSDRLAGVLRVQHANLEVHADGADAAERIAPVLRLAAEWQGLDRIEVGQNGDWSAQLRAVLLGAS